MKKIIILTLIAVALSGCSKKKAISSWDVSVVITTNQTIELHTTFEKSTTSQLGPRVGFKIEKMKIQPLILEPNVPTEDDSGAMHRKAIYNTSDRTVTFELSAEYDEVPYSTNGVITIR